MIKIFKKKIIFIGTYISSHNQNPSQAEILIEKLEDIATVRISSSKLNPFFRILDMVFTVFKNRGENTLIFIDTYSHLAFWYSILISLICRLWRIKYIPILRGGNLPSTISRFYNISKFIFKGSTINIAPSEYIKEEFKKMNIQTHKISNFIELEKYNFKSRTNLEPNLLWVRSFHKSYNPIMAVHVLYVLKEKYSNSRLTMIGPDKDGTLEECRDLARDLKLNKSIDFKGYMEKNDWINISKDFDIFINTTNYDNMPVSIIEAMALGFPIISTKVGGIKHLLNDGVDSFLVPKNDINMMSKRIIELIEDASLAYQFSKKSRRQSVQYSWRNIENQWYEILKKY